MTVRGPVFVRKGAVVRWYPDPPDGYDSAWDAFKRWWQRRRARRAQ